MEFRHRHIFSVDQFDKGDIQKIFNCADRAQALLNKGERCEMMDGKILTTMIFGKEGSTRSLPSFSTAMMRMGGLSQNINEATSSTPKGESLGDTTRIISNLCDVFVIRHPEKGAAEIAVGHSSVPVINAGDGTGEHPTQALLDLYTLEKEVGLRGVITVAMVNDLRHGRTVHSFAKILALRGNVKFIFIALPQLQMPDEIVEMLQNQGYDVTITDDFDAIKKADVVYMTRPQRERMNDDALYEATRQRYVLNASKVMQCSTDITVMHPLPRAGEITEEVDILPRAAYFRQAFNGLPIRMALIALLLKKADQL